METEALLREISDYCRKAGMAETTFGRRAVNDGKFVSRLKYGGKVTTTTVERVRHFMSSGMSSIDSDVAELGGALKGFDSRLAGGGGNGGRPAESGDPEKNFRFYDNRQKYLMFVNTTSEKWVVASRIAQELANLHPRPPGLRIFDAGVGDGTVLTRLMRAMHQRFDKIPFYIVGKEISLEDTRLALEKMPDRFYEHPSTVLVMTNMNYAEAPWLSPSSAANASRVVWHEVALRGSTAADFEDQITELQPFLAENWRAGVSAKSGNPVYEKPVVLILYREDCRFALDGLLPKRGALRAEYDLVVASQPFRARAPVEFKAKRVLAPLAKALAPGGRLLGINSCGGDPALEIVQRVWPGEQPFTSDRHDLLRATKTELGKAARHFNFISGADARAIFRYDMHTLPNEIDNDQGSIGTSTLLAAWNAATYVAQIEDQRLAEVMNNDYYLSATKEVLKKHGGLWFFDESYVISRKRDLA